MSNYTKSTNFLAKDSLPSGNAGKVIKGSEIDTEFNNIATSIATKADVNSPTLTGTPSAPTAEAGTNTAQIATTAFVTTNFPTQDTTWSGNQTFKDNKFEIVDNGDATKKVALEVSGVTTGTTRTLTVPDKSGTVALTSDVADPLDATSNSIISGSYSVSTSSTITFTSTNTLVAGQKVYITFTATSGATLTNGKYTVVSASSGSFTITYGSSVTSSGTFKAERYGAIALANSTEALDRTKNLKALSPATLRDAINAQNAAPIYACRAWVVFDATRNAAGTVDATNTTRYIYASGNVTSVTKTNTGTFTVALDTAMPNANYAITGQAKAAGTSANNATMVFEQYTPSRSTSNVYINTAQRDSGTDAAFTNPTYVSVAIFG